MPEDRPLPIDIDYSKFLPWLIDRRRIPSDWHIHLKAARTLARTAYTETPSDITAELSLPSTLAAHDFLPYHSCRTALRTLLAESAPAAWGSRDTDLLGRFKSPLHRAWAAAVAAFEKSHVYLADSAQLLVRHADVDASAMRQGITRLTAELTDLTRKEGPAQQAVVDALHRFHTECAQYGIALDDPTVVPDFHIVLRAKVHARVCELLREMATAAKVLAEPRQFYQAFADYVSLGHARNVCPTLQDVIRADLDSVTRDPIAQSTHMQADEDEGHGGGGIDWGIELDASAASAGATGSEADIDWGIEVDAAGAEAESNQIAKEIVVEETTADTINWDIDVAAESGETAATDAKADDGSVTLASAETRVKYINDLYELDDFLEMREEEFRLTSVQDMGVLMRVTADMPVGLRKVSEDSVMDMRQSVCTAMNAVDRAQGRHYLALHGNARLLDRAARGLLRMRLTVDRAEQATVSSALRKRRVADQVADEKRKLVQLGKVTRAVLEDTEKALSKLYQGRTVNVLGEINNIFPAER